MDAVLPAPGQMYGRSQCQEGRGAQKRPMFKQGEQSQRETHDDDPLEDLSPSGRLELEHGEDARAQCLDQQQQQ